MDGPRDDQTKSDKERQLSYDTTYMRNLKIPQTKKYNKVEADSQIKRTN